MCLSGSLMRGFDLYWYDFTQLLSAAPGTREDVRDLLQQGYSVTLPKTSYEVLWDRLSEQLGEERAADAVCEVVIATAPPRLFDLIDELWETGSASHMCKGKCGSVHLPRTCLS